MNDTLTIRGLVVSVALLVVAAFAVGAHYVGTYVAWLIASLVICVASMVHIFCKNARERRQLPTIWAAIGATISCVALTMAFLKTVPFEKDRRHNERAVASLCNHVSRQSRYADVDIRYSPKGCFIRGSVKEEAALMELRRTVKAYSLTVSVMWDVKVNNADVQEILPRSPENKDE